MILMSPETQLRSYASLRSLETRALALDALIGSIKRTCLHGGPGAVTEIITSTAELRWQLRKVADLIVELEANLGVQRSGDPKADKTDKARKTDKAEEPAGMRGTTQVLPVPDLVSLLSTLRKTGTLALHAGDSMFVFEFEQGKIVHAVTNHANPDLRLGTILVAQSKLTEEQLQECLRASSEANALLGSHLVQSATVTESDLRAALDVQVARIFDLAFAVKDARFTFVEGSVSAIAQRTALNTVHLLLEAARQTDQHRQEGGPEAATIEAKHALDSILGS